MPQIAILTPVYNGLPYLRECVDSVLAQDFQDWEMIISDNGSKDGTRDYLKTLTDPRIRVFEQPANLGIFGNLNFVFAQARAPLAQILCADDYFLNATALREILRLWARQPAELAFLRCNWGHGVRKCQLQKLTVAAMPPVVPPERSDLYFFMFGSVTGNLSNVSVRTPVVRECGWFREDLPYAGDCEFWIRAAREHGFALETANLVYVRQHPQSGTNTLSRKGELVRQQYGIMSDLFQRLKSVYPPFFLRLHATANYDSQQRWIGLASRFKTGSGQYLAEVRRWSAVSECFLGPVARWLICLGTVGGRFGRATFARWLLRYEGKIHGPAK